MLLIIRGERADLILNSYPSELSYDLTRSYPFDLQAGRVGRLIERIRIGQTGHRLYYHPSGTSCT
jgi:hypothetical protein